MNSNLESPVVRFGFGLGAFFFFISGPISGFFLTRIFFEAKASADWPNVPGILTRAEVLRNELGRFRADVTYSYKVTNEAFTGTRIRASDGEYDNRDGAVQAIRGLIPNQQVQVYYNPADPRRAVLRPGVGFQEYALLFIPVLMSAIGAYAFSKLWRTRTNGEATRPVAS